jgi:hypothetical protein
VPTGDRAVSDRLEEKSVSRLTVCRSRSAPGSNSKAGQHESRGLRQPGGLSPGVRHLFAGRKVKPETKVGQRFEAPTGESTTCAAVLQSRCPWLLSGVARGGKDNGGDFQKQPHQSELHNYSKDQWKKIW